MASKKNEQTQENGTNGTNGAPPEAELPKLSGDEVKALIAKYTAADDNIAKMEAALEKAKEQREALCKKLFEGRGAGKYRVRDAVLTLRGRKHKGSERIHYYFVGQADEEEILG